MGDFIGQVKSKGATFEMHLLKGLHFFAPLSLKSYDSLTFMLPYFSFHGLSTDSDFFHIDL